MDHGWMDEWMDEWMMNGWIDGSWMDGWIDGWMDGWKITGLRLKLWSGESVFPSSKSSCVATATAAISLRDDRPRAVSPNGGEGWKCNYNTVNECLLTT